MLVNNLFIPQPPSLKPDNLLKRQVDAYLYNVNNHASNSQPSVRQSFPEYLMDTLT